jgi:hypothetical protein
MKKLYIILAILLAVQLTGYSQKNKERGKLKVMSDTIAVDSVEYEIIIIDPGFDSWLTTRPSMNYYSQNYYENKNRFYVTEWNYRHDNPIRFGDLYDTRIDYDFSTNYGLELNYKLYNYFIYFEETNHVKLVGLRR